MNPLVIFLVAAFLPFLPLHPIFSILLLLFLLLLFFLLRFFSFAFFSLLSFLFYFFFFLLPSAFATLPSLALVSTVFHICPNTLLFLPPLYLPYSPINFGIVASKPWHLQDYIPLLFSDHIYLCSLSMSLVINIYFHYIFY